MSRSRSRRRNNHHLLWPASDYRWLVYKQARTLPCCQVQIDIEVHRVLHKLYDLPRKISDADARKLIERHEKKQCACYDGTQTTLELLGEGENDDEEGPEDGRQLRLV